MTSQKTIIYVILAVIVWSVLLGLSVRILTEQSSRTSFDVRGYQHISTEIQEESNELIRGSIQNFNAQIDNLLMHPSKYRFAVLLPYMDQLRASTNLVEENRIKKYRVGTEDMTLRRFQKELVDELVKNRRSLDRLVEHHKDAFGYRDDDLPIEVSGFEQSLERLRSLPLDAYDQMPISAEPVVRMTGAYLSALHELWSLLGELVGGRIIECHFGVSQYAAILHPGGPIKQGSSSVMEVRVVDIFPNIWHSNVTIIIDGDTLALSDAGQALIRPETSVPGYHEVNLELHTLNPITEEHYVSHWVDGYWVE